MVNLNNIKRGDIYYADLSGSQGSEQGGIRPVLVIQNNLGNKYSPCIIVAAITSQMTKTKLLTHVLINAGESGLTKDSVILAEQIRTVDKKRIKGAKITTLNGNIMDKVDNAMAVSFGLTHGGFAA